jgi:hypothetical protein
MLFIITFSTFNISNAGVWSDLIDGSKPKINVDCATKDCSLTT